MKSVGIDIGSSSLKVCEVLQTSKGIQVLRFEEWPLGQNPSHDINLEIHELLSTLSSRYGSNQTKVVAAIRQDRVSVRSKNFPFSDRLKILKSLPFELEEDLPFSSETAIYDARVIRQAGPTSELLACAIPKRSVVEILEKISSSGLSIQILTAEGLAFANSYIDWQSAPPLSPAPTIDLLDDAKKIEIAPRILHLQLQLGHEHSLVCAFENNQLVAVRSVLWGASNIVKAIARKYEIPEIEAAQELKSKAFILPNKDNASYDQVVFSDTISGQFKDFCRELRLSILEIETELHGKVISAEYTGGLAGVLNLSAFLTQSLELQVNRSSPLAGFQTLFEKTPAIENSIGTALGLALEGLRKPKNPALQFLRGELAPKNESMQIFFQTWKSTFACAASLVVLFFIYSYLRESFSLSLNERATEQIQIQAKSVAKLTSKQANESGVKKYIRDKRKRAQELKQLEGLAKMNSALEVLRNISDSAPGKSQAGIDIKVFKIEDSKIYMMGIARNPNEKNALQKSLTSIAKNGKVDNQPANSSPGALGVPFAFQFQVDRGTE